MRDLREETEPVPHTLIPVGNDWYSLPVREIKNCVRKGYSIDRLGIGEPPYRLVRWISKDGDEWSWRDSQGNPLITTTQSFGTYEQCKDWGDAVEAGKRPPIIPQHTIEWKVRRWATDGKICVELGWLYSVTDDRECCDPLREPPKPEALDSLEADGFSKCLPIPDQDVREYRAYLHTETRQVFHMFVPQRSTMWTGLDVEATLCGVFRGTIAGEPVVYQMRVGEEEVERWRDQ